MAFLVKSNIYVSLASAALYLYYAILLKIDFFISTPVFIFSGTFFAYNFLRLISIFRKDKESIELGIWYRENKVSLILVSLLLLPALIYGVFDLTSTQLLFLSLSAACVLFYERFFFKNFSMRSVPFFKPIIIALTWTFICVGVHLESSIEMSAILALSDCFIFIFFLSLLFDYKDIDSDKRSHIKSVTHLKSTKSFSLFMGLLLTTYLLLLFTVFQFHTSNVVLFFIYALGFIVSTIISIRSLKKPILFCLITDGLILYKALFGIYLL